MRTFTQLIGTTLSTSFSTYGDAFTTLAKNNSASAVTIGKSLVNNEHRNLLQKYFDNERTVIAQTIGGESLTLTGSLAVGVTSATLSSSWTRITCQQYVNFSSGEQRYVQFTSGSTAITWSGTLTLTATTAITSVGVQDYNIPADVSKIKDDTINVGQLKLMPIFVHTRQEWDSINFLPYTSDIPVYCFIYNGKLSLFPIPATTGNIITFNYKARVPDLSFDDYSTGTLAAAGMVVGSTTVTGLSTSWSVTGLYPLNTNLSFYNLFIRANPPYGDGIWYPILKFNSDTSLTLSLPVINAPNITSATTYTIGQLPLLQEDFQPALVYGALRTYFGSIAPDKVQQATYEGLYKERLEALSDYAGTKQVNVDLENEPPLVNPNLFLYANS